MTELKPCFFCGGKAFIRKLYTNYIVDAAHEELKCPLAYHLLSRDTGWVTREAAIHAWNRRVGEDG